MENNVVKTNGSPLFERKVEFRSATKKRTFNELNSNCNGDFRIDTLNPKPDHVKTGSKLDGSEFGLDPELNFGSTLCKIGAGLKNLGNTCFLNSVLQCLTYTEPLAAYLQSGKHQSSCHIAGFCALCAIQEHVSRALRSTGSILAPKDLVANLRRISRTFRNARQEDAHEYMVNLLESMHRCCLPSGIPSGSPNAYEKSLVHKIFGGRLRSQVKCLECFHCSNKFDPFLDLSLEIANADSLCKTLKNFTVAEQLDGGERQYNCQQCNQKVRALKQLTIDKAPYVLTIHLKRFLAYDPDHKINKKVQFDPTMDLKPFVSGSYEGDLRYTLYGVLVHSGWSTHSGHYYCFVRTSSGMWYSLDDNQVVQVSELTVLKQKAYMLFYVRDRKSSAMKKSMDVSQKGNLEKDVGGNKSYLNITIQNGANQRVPESANLTPSATKNLFGLRLGKSDCGQESTLRSANSVLSESSFPKKDIIQQPSSKDPAQRSPSMDPGQKSPSMDPVEKSPPEDPVQKSPPEDPVQKSPPEDPVQQSPSKDPVQQSASKDPVQQSPPKDPVQQSPLKDPVQQSPSKDPVQQSPSKDPVQQSPSKDPVQQSPSKDPVQQSPSKDPVQQSPSKDPVRQTPLKDPVQQSLLKDPVPQSPSMDALQQSSIKDPVQQSSSEVVNPLKALSKAKPLISSALSITGNGYVEQNPITVIQGSWANSQDYDGNRGSLKNSDVSLLNSSDYCYPQESAAFKVLADGTAQKIEPSSNEEGPHKDSFRHREVGKLKKVVDLIRPPSKPSPESIQDNSVSSNSNTPTACGKNSKDYQKSAPESQELPSSSNLSSKSMVMKASNHTQQRIFSRRYINGWTAGMRMGTRILLRANLELWKKKADKRSRYHSPDSCKLIQESFQELGPSTSDNTSEIFLNTTRGGKKVMKFCSKKKVDKLAKKKSRKPGRFDQNSAVLATDCSNIGAGHCDANGPNNAEDIKRETIQNSFFNMLTQGLEETGVPRWDGIDIPAVRDVESTKTKDVSINHMPDKWDEEYDRGRKRKLSLVKHGCIYEGPNPFQRIANKKSKRSRMDQSKSGNEPSSIQ